MLDVVNCNLNLNLCVWPLFVLCAIVHIKFKCVSHANLKIKFEFFSQIYAISHLIFVVSANERTIFSLKKNGKVPGYVFDGMTSDVNGNLYITTFGGHKVMKIDPK